MEIKKDSNNDNELYISILMPIYNGIEFLEESLLSIINQTYDKWELIIGINGYEKDSIVEKKANDIVNKLNNDLKYNIIVNYYNTNGKTETLNKMVLDSKYDYIALLDVDDKWLPKKLEEQSKYIKKYDVVGTNCKYFGDRDDSPVLPFGNFTQEHNIFMFNPIINSSVIIKKKDAYWNENEKNGLEDYDLWFKLYNEKKEFYNLSDILCYHRIHQNSNFNNNNYKDETRLKQKWMNIIFTTI